MIPMFAFVICWDLGREGLGIDPCRWLRPFLCGSCLVAFQSDRRVRSLLVLVASIAYFFMLPLHGAGSHSCYVLGFLGAFSAKGLHCISVRVWENTVLEHLRKALHQHQQHTHMVVMTSFEATKLPVHAPGVGFHHQQLLHKVLGHPRDLGDRLVRPKAGGLDKHVHGMTKTRMTCLSSSSYDPY